MWKNILLTCQCGISFQLVPITNSDFVIAGEVTNLVGNLVDRSLYGCWTMHLTAHFRPRLLYLRPASCILHSLSCSLPILVSAPSLLPIMDHSILTFLFYVQKIFAHQRPTSICLTLVIFILAK